MFFDRSCRGRSLSILVFTVIGFPRQALGRNSMTRLPPAAVDDDVDDDDDNLAFPPFPSPTRRQLGQAMNVLEVQPCIWGLVATLPTPKFNSSLGLHPSGLPPTGVLPDLPFLAPPPLPVPECLAGPRVGCNDTLRRHPNPPLLKCTSRYWSLLSGSCKGALGN